MVDLVLALVAIGRLTKIDRKAMNNQKWISYNFDECRIMVLWAKLPLVWRGVSGAKERDGECPKLKPRYQE